MRIFSRLRGHVGGRPPSSPVRKAKARPAAGGRLRLLTLEDRRVPSTVQVTSPLDDGSAATLRYAVDHAHNGDKIFLAGGALGGITLTPGELLLKSRALRIQSSTGQPVAISGGGVSRVFEVAAGANVTLGNLIVTGGNAQTGNPDDPHEGRGGGIVVDEGGVLKITDC